MHTEELLISIYPIKSSEQQKVLPYNYIIFSWHSEFNFLKMFTVLTNKQNQPSYTKFYSPSVDLPPTISYIWYKTRPPGKVSIYHIIYMRIKLHLLHKPSQYKIKRCMWNGCVYVTKVTKSVKGRKHNICLFMYLTIYMNGNKQLCAYS